MIKRISKITALCIIIYINIIIPFYLKAEEIPKTKDKVVIYHLNDNSKSDQFRYYSYIIPTTLKFELEKEKIFQINLFPDPIDYQQFIDSSQSDDAEQNFIDILTRKAEELSAEYMIIGSYTAEKRKLSINIQLFDVNAQEIFETYSDSEDLGALLQDVIDNLSKDIKDELLNSYNRKKDDEKDDLSPFLGFYNVISGFTFGFNYGIVNIYGNWGDIYENPKMITGYIQYELNNIDFLKETPILKNIALSANYDFFSSNSRDNENTNHSFLSVTGITINMVYLCRFSSYFNLAFSAGWGQSESEIYIEGEDGDGPYSTPLSENTTKDNLLSFSVYTNIIISHAHIMAGYAYKTILYSDDPLKYSVFYFGMGYRI
ncbi:MAG: hypothetical protein SVR08_07970 [Spirochaetota bacterium]|nr:hypothetical protein [Spirochaetota bacterium]